MIASWLGRFFRHCIDMAALADTAARGIRFDQYDPAFMTDQEIRDFLHGSCRNIDWDRIKLRRERGERQEPWAAGQNRGIGA